MSLANSFSSFDAISISQFDATDVYPRSESATAAVVRNSFQQIRGFQGIPFRHKYTLRFLVSGFNLTNHFNPLDVHANLSNPLSGVFLGN
jgi:hypothetical protein